MSSSIFRGKCSLVFKNYGHIGEGRFLQPENFSKEIRMRFNLGPLHLLQRFAEETVEERGKEYFRKYPPRNLNLTSDRDRAENS